MLEQLRVKVVLEVKLKGLINLIRRATELFTFLLLKTRLQILLLSKN